MVTEAANINIHNIQTSQDNLFFVWHWRCALSPKSCMSPPGHCGHDWPVSPLSSPGFAMPNRGKFLFESSFQIKLVAVQDFQFWETFKSVWPEHPSIIEILDWETRLVFGSCKLDGDFQLKLYTQDSLLRISSHWENSLRINEGFKCDAKTDTTQFKV